MSALIHRPCASLSEWVDCLWLWDGYPAPASRERALPSGTLDLVINLEENRQRFYVGERAETLLELPGVTLSGAHAGYFMIGTSQRTSMIGVHFKPGGAFPFLGVPARDLEGRHAPLEALWGAAARTLRERVLAAPSGKPRLLALEAALLERPRAALARPRQLTLALAAFEDPGLASVAEVRQRTGLSAKRLIALFADEVGLTPKAFWRVRRFQAALRAVERRTPGDAALALGLGYFDQAHFDREFRHFTGLSPRAYRAEAIERPNHVQLRG
jgi:AraC-like DNA-binding protein